MLAILRCALLVLLFAFSVCAPAQTTVTLQEGLNGYTGSADARLGNSDPGNYNGTTWGLRMSSEAVVLRFAIFQAEGGPVPDGATITSATLSAYKFWGADAVVKAERLLRAWQETEVTWYNATTGSAWATPGALGASDVTSSGAAQGSVGTAEGWLNFDVTAVVQAFAGGASNHGWRLEQIAGDTGTHDFIAKDHATQTALRPRLTISYAANSAPTAQLLVGSPWVSAGAQATTDVTPEGEAQASIGIDPGWLDYDVIATVQAWSAGAPNHGWRMRQIAGATQPHDFIAKDHPTQATLRPKLAIAYSSPAPGGTATLQEGLNGYAGSADTWMWSDAPDTNYGSETDWEMRLNTTTATLLRFPIFQSEGGPVPDGATITAATLSVYKFNGPDGTFNAKRLLRRWAEAQATWNHAVASPASGQAPLSVTFDASRSQDNGSPITSLRLQFGDGQEVTWSDKNQTQQHTYTTAGEHTAALTVTNAVGTSAPSTQTITVTSSSGNPPTANLVANPSSGAAPLTVTFDASASADGSAPITSLRLQFGDGTEVTWSDKTQPQTHQYSASGEYIATLTATNSYGTSPGHVQQVQVTDPNTSEFPSPLPASGVAVPTFHSMGLYYNPSSAPAGNRVFMRYRRATEDPNGAGFTWKRGHDLWYDSRNLHNYDARGSAVHLLPGTKYVFELGTGADYASANWQNHIEGTTWSETFPVGTTLTPWTGTNTTTTSSNYKGSRSGSTRQHVLLANQSGTASGYTLYDFTGANAVAQTANQSGRFPVVISGSYIIIRGLKTVGGESGIFIDPGSQDIVIENCDISGYGRDGGLALGSGLSGNRGVNEDAGIKFPDSSYGPIFDTRSIVIQRSRIYNPAFGSNPWDTGHPLGPSPITMYQTGGQIVIRYNSVYSTTNGLPDGPPNLSKFHQDGLVLGGENGEGIGPDVDIYKNLVLHYYDDGVETDGDGTNTRIWGNYFDYGGASAVSTAPTRLGPAYVWRNVYNRARMFITDPWGNERDRLYMLKSGGMGGINGGRRYIYHNTSMQPPYTSEATASGPNPLGAGFGTGGNGAPNGMHNTVTRNNVFEIWRSSWGTFDLIDALGNDLDYDLSNGNFTEPNGIRTTPQYQTGNGWSAYWNGRYRLQSGTAGHNDGAPIPNFNDGFVGTAPDRGAHEDGTPDMTFGTNASGS